MRYSRNHNKTLFTDLLQLHLQLKVALQLLISYLSLFGLQYNTYYRLGILVCTSTINYCNLTFSLPLYFWS